MRRSRPTWKLRAERARQAPLEQVARRLDYRIDPRNRQRWRRPGSVLSISGPKFFDHLSGHGGGGAIDLVMHARSCSFLEALDWLDGLHHASQAPDAPAAQPRQYRPAARPVLLLPADCRPCWPAVRRYLADHRRLCPQLLLRCRQQGLLWSDRRQNAVFLCRDRDGHPTGAEIAGTRPDPHGHTFKGLAQGSRKRRGGFWLPPPGDDPPTRLLLTESAIDTLSACLLPRHVPPATLIASTAGLTSRRPAWLADFQVGSIFCGYDTDPAGERAAELLSLRHPGIRRLRPPHAKDWNELLQSQS